MDYRALNTGEITTLREALRRNVDGAAILVDRRDTSFAGVADEVPEDEVIAAVRSIPCHF